MRFLDFKQHFKAFRVFSVADILKWDRQFDAVFLLSKNIKPDYRYLKMKADIQDSKTLKEKCSTDLFSFRRG